MNIRNEKYAYGAAGVIGGTLLGYWLRALIDPRLTKNEPKKKDVRFIKMLAGALVVSFAARFLFVDSWIWCWTPFMTLFFFYFIDFFFAGHKAAVALYIWFSFFIIVPVWSIAIVPALKKAMPDIVQAIYNRVDDIDYKLGKKIDTEIPTTTTRRYDETTKQALQIEIDKIVEERSALNEKRKTKLWKPKDEVRFKELDKKYQELLGQKADIEHSTQPQRQGGSGKVSSTPSPQATLTPEPAPTPVQKTGSTETVARVPFNNPHPEMHPANNGWDKSGMTQNVSDTTTSRPSQNEEQNIQISQSTRPEGRNSVPTIFIAEPEDEQSFQRSLPGGYERIAFVFGDYHTDDQLTNVFRNSLQMELTHRGEYSVITDQSRRAKNGWQNTDTTNPNSDYQMVSSVGIRKVSVKKKGGTGKKIFGMIGRAIDNRKADEIMREASEIDHERYETTVEIVINLYITRPSGHTIVKAGSGKATTRILSSTSSRAGGITSEETSTSTVDRAIQDALRRALDSMR